MDAAICTVVGRESTATVGSSPSLDSAASSADEDFLDRAALPVGGPADDPAEEEEARAAFGQGARDRQAAIVSLARRLGFEVADHIALFLW